MLQRLEVNSRCLPTVVFNILLLLSLLLLLFKSSKYRFGVTSAYIQLPQSLVSKFLVHSLQNDVTVIILFSVINGWNCRADVAVYIQHIFHKSEEYFQNLKKGVGTCFIYTERSQVAQCISLLVLCQCLLLYISCCNHTASNALRS